MIYQSRKIFRYLLLFVIGILIIITTTKAFAEIENSPTDIPAQQEVKIDEKNLDLTPEQLKFIEADKLYLAGDITAASALYQELKPDFDQQSSQTSETISPPIYDADKLPPGGAVYWRLAQQGLEQNLETKILISLNLLVDNYPEFIPGHLLYAQTLKNSNNLEQAAQVLEKAITLYDDQPELLEAAIATLAENEQWLEASLIARQFALIHQEHPQAEEFTNLANENLDKYKRHLRSELTGNAIANILTGTLGYFITKNLSGPVATIQSTVLLLQGESVAGKEYADYLREKLPLLEDPEVLDYVSKIGNQLAALSGRDEFSYEFYILMDERLNAFALPGGKIFINAGALMKTNSEAEFAGLLAHELSHAVLSHGFQLMTQGNLTANVFQFIPYGYTVANLVVLDYSRDMEKQADILGTKMLTASGYAADGLRNLTNTLYQEKENKKRTPPKWLSSHPATKDRISYLEELIIKNGYDRYGYEGVLNHIKIKHKVTHIMEKYQEEEGLREAEEELKGKRQEVQLETF